MSDEAAPAVAILEPAGAVNSRAAVAFEREVLAHLEKGRRGFVVDFSKVELFTSAGIRVLVMLRQRLPSIGGQLVLCGMSPHVRLVFDVAGLASQFTIVDKQAEAILKAGVAPVAPPEAVRPPASDLVRAVRRALEGAAGTLPDLSPSASPPPSPLTRAVRAALERENSGR